MAKKKDEKDVLVVRDEKTGEISVVAGLNADGTPKRTPAKAEMMTLPGVRARTTIGCSGSPAACSARRTSR